MATGLIRIGDRCHLKADPSRIFRVTRIIPENLSGNEMAQLVVLSTGATAYWHTQQLVRIGEK
ncbi:hypothetical protein [Pantanalinema sp. GBBB05]|uniref:hypothetical protein n=1 Tax=Pantanalinema sp. GBBB05 TaxID=2604139 RepID=UPI001DFC0F9E|nr:hypothetical protein [Pantanalinema sp. GBBB05]